MRSKSSLKAALIDDTVGFVAGLAMPTLFSIAGYPIVAPFLFSTIRWIKQQLSWHRRTEYVDWNLADWPIWYSGDIDRCVIITHRARRYRLPQVLVHDNTHLQPLSEANIRFEFNDKPFLPTPQTLSLTERPYEAILRRIKRKRTFYDEEAIRLLGIVETSSSLILKVQPVAYTSYLRTNLILDYKVRRHETLRDVLHSSGSLEPLDKSPLANPLGINVLIFTADGSLVLQKRSKDVDIRPGELAPAGSGSMTRTDAEVTGKAAVKPITIMREVIEETGIPLESLIGKSLTYLGITRELIRGGKPEIFFSAGTNLSERDIRSLWSRAHDRHEAKDIRTQYLGSIVFEPINSTTQFNRLMVATDELLDEVWGQASIPLKTAIALWIDQKTRQFNSLKADI